MSAQVIGLNRGSSPGKSTTARCLQTILGAPWLVLGVGTLVDAMPAWMQAGGSGIGSGPGGRVSAGPAFRALEAARMSGIAAMARTGANVYAGMYEVSRWWWLTAASRAVG